MKIVLASNNRKKIIELNALLAPIGHQLVAQSELGVDEAPEPFATFVENALSKARHASQCTGLPALADDSGLCVAALNGAPGVHSARWAGEPADDAANNAKLLRDLAASANPDRQAEFVCVMVFVRHADDPLPLISVGRWLGRILQAPRGQHGFGYDPLFWVDSEQASAAELAADVKNRLSHRGLAIRQLIAQMSDLAA